MSGFTPGEQLPCPSPPSIELPHIALMTTFAHRSTVADVAAPPGQYWQWRDQAIHFVQAGKRSDLPPLLLIHGFGASTDHWRKTIHGLQADYEVWAIDLLGFGRSAKPNWEYSGSVWRDQLRDFVTQVIQRPTVLVGNSLGGYAALLTAAQCPEVAAGVVLINSAGPFSDAAAPSRPISPARQGIQDAVRTFMLQPVPSWLLFQLARRKSRIRQVLKQVYVDQTAVTDRLVEEIYRPSCDRGAAQVFASVFKSPRGEPNDVLLQQLQRPLLIIWGEGDPWMKARDRSAKFRQYYPELTEHFLAAGHCPHDEAPDQVNAILRDWVQTL